MNSCGPSLTTEGRIDHRLTQMDADKKEQRSSRLCRLMCACATGAQPSRLHSPYLYRLPARTLALQSSLTDTCSCSFASYDIHLMRDFVVLMVGAGPAGSFAAERLARAGVRVALIDGRPAGEPKACGGGVTSKALKAWPQLLEATGRTVEEVEMYSPA